MNTFNQHPHRLAPDLLGGRANCGERRRKKAGDGNIIETDDRHIARNFPACFLQGRKHPDGSVIIASEDRIEVNSGPQHLADGFGASCSSNPPVAVRAGSNGRRCFFERLTVAALAPEQIFVAFGPAQVHDSAASVRFDEVADQFFGAILVFDSDEWETAMGRGSFVQQDDWEIEFVIAA